MKFGHDGYSFLNAVSVEVEQCQCPWRSARIWLNNLARQSKNTVSRAATIPVDAITTTKSLIPFTIPPSGYAVRWLPADGAAQCTFNLHAKELELTRRYAEPLRVGHHAATVKQRHDSVFSIQQRINLFVDPLHINAERLSQGHDLSPYPKMLRRAVPAIAGTSVRWRAGPASPTPPSIARWLRRAGTHRHKGQPWDPTADGARA